MYRSPTWIPSFSNSFSVAPSPPRAQAKAPWGKKGPRNAKAEKEAGGRCGLVGVFQLSHTQTQGMGFSLSGQGLSCGDWVQTLIPPMPMLAGTVQVCNQPTPHFPEE